MSSRELVDRASVSSKDGSVTATVTISESVDGLTPLVRVNVTGRGLKVVEFWAGSGADGSDIDIDHARSDEGHRRSPTAVPHKLGNQSPCA